MTCHFEWIPGSSINDGSFWSLWSKNRYHGYVNVIEFPVKAFRAGKPGGVNEKKFQTMKEAAIQVLEWAKTEVQG